MDPRAAAEAIESFLRALGHDPGSPALQGTGARVASLFADELLDGYHTDLDTLFRDPIPVAEGAPLVVVQRLATHVVCPHHLTIGRGHASLAYLPSDRVVGLGELAKLVDVCAHRLVLQEDVGTQVVTALVDRLGAKGAACVLTLRHGCLEHHGERKRGARVRTVSFAGSFATAGPDRDLAIAALLDPPKPARARR